MDEVLRLPLALGDPANCEGYARQVDHFQRQQTALEPLIAHRVATFDVMMTLVSVGLALGLVGAARIASSRSSEAGMPGMA